MKSRAKDRAKAEVYVVKTALKEDVGWLMDDPHLEGEGDAQKIVKVQGKLGQVKKVPREVA
jgi:uncharacterized protein YjbJ (UPF0337 family)